MRFLKIISLASILIFTACSSDAGKSTTTAIEKKDSVAPAKETFPIGEVISPLYSHLDATLSYSMYIPKAYDGKKLFPIIFTFDPHATGKLPVTMYKDLAEKYGFILVASNNSQNGMAWEQTQAIGASMITDLQSRLSIDPKAMYVMGFSGGARVANAMVISTGSLAGAICCGASHPASGAGIQRTNYVFMGFAGNADFNMLEMIKYDMTDLSSNSIKHAMHVFDGKHEWPSAEVMDDGFLFLQLDEMGRKCIPTNDSLVKGNIKKAEVELDKLIKQKKVYEEFELCRKTVSFYERLGDLTKFYDVYKNLKTSPDLDKALKLKEVAFKKEDELKQFYIDGLQNKNTDWWKHEVASMNKTIKTSKDKEDVFLQKRILSYLSLACYMQVSGLIKQRNLEGAEYFCNLYMAVDPTNNEAYYLMAELDAAKGKADDAVKMLNESVKNGFVDFNRADNDSAFIQLKTDAEFMKTLNSIKK